MIYVGTDFIGEGTSLGGIKIPAQEQAVNYTNSITVTGATATAGFSSSNEFKGQMFTTVSAGNFGRLGVQAWKLGSPTGTMAAELWSFNGTNPVAKIADSSNAFDVATLPSADPGSINAYWTFPSTALTNATQYVWLINGAGAAIVNGVNTVILSRSTSSIYAGGAYVLSTYSNILSSTQDGSGRDLNFTIDYIS